MNKDQRRRGEAYTGKGYGTLRYDLFVHSRDHIIHCINHGYYLEATAVIESIIADRLESRLSYLKGDNFAFKTLGKLIQESRISEDDPELRAVIEEIDDWRWKRNQALHEMVKVEEGRKLSWEDRLSLNKQIAIMGFETLVKVYTRVGDLNPLHFDQVFRREDLPHIK